MTLSFKFWTIIFSVMLLASGLYGQSASSLHLTVVDQQTGRIPKGEVRLLRVDGSVIAEKVINVSGSVIFEGLSKEDVTIEIESPGFEVFREGVRLKDGINSIVARLDIKKIKVEVEVDQSVLDIRLNRAFSSMLSREEIDSLPDDPQEIEKELKRRYGDDIVIRVNGFSGGLIPPKEAIRSIQVNRSSFDAEYHELGRPSVNIITKASTRKLMGTLLFNYGNSALNARNAFAQTKLPEQINSIAGFVSGPLRHGKSSFNASFNRLVRSEKQDIITSLPGEPPPQSEPLRIESRNFSGGIDYDINLNHTLRLDYQNTLQRVTNAGVGGLNLAKRGLSTERVNNEIKISLNGTFAQRFANQFRSRLSLKKNRIASNSEDIGITVADAFNAGGAGLNSNLSTNQLELFEMVSLGTGSHFIKFGGELRYERAKLLSANGTNGNFFFSSLENYLLRKPAMYFRTEGTTDLTFNRYDLSLFAQDDFRAAKRLNIGFGLRYEIQNHVSDANNFSPRLSVTVAADEKGRVILRSGAGVLYHWREVDNIRRIMENDGRQSRQVVIVNPGFPNPYNEKGLQETLSPSIYSRAEYLQTPYIFVAQTALNINLGDGLRFDATYKFERGVHQFRSRDINAPVGGVRPDPEFGRIRVLESSGTSTRNALEVSSEGVLFKRVRVNGRYRLSKLTDDYADAFSLPMDSHNLRVERGTSNLDQRHYFTGHLDFSPFKDFSLNPSFIIASPLPYTITTGLDNNGDTVFNDRPDGIGRNTARGSWTKAINLGVTWSFPILKRSVTIKKDGKKETVENLPDALRHHKITLSININNLFNSTNKSGFIGNQLSPFYGRATVAAPARNITFGLMFLYF